MQDGATSHTTNLHINFLSNDKFQVRTIPLLINHKTQMAVLQSRYEPSFHSFVWSYIQDQFYRIEHELISKLHQAVGDVAATIPTEMTRDAVQNLRNRAQAFLEASGLYLKHLV